MTKEKYEVVTYHEFSPRHAVILNKFKIEVDVKLNRTKYEEFVYSTSRLIKD